MSSRQQMLNAACSLRIRVQLIKVKTKQTNPPDSQHMDGCASGALPGTLQAMLKHAFFICALRVFSIFQSRESLIHAKILHKIHSLTHC